MNPLVVAGDGVNNLAIRQAVRSAANRADPPTTGGEDDPDPEAGGSGDPHQPGQPEEPHQDDPHQPGGDD